MLSFGDHLQGVVPAVHASKVVMRRHRAIGIAWALVLSPLAVSAIVLRVAIYSSLSFVTASCIFVAAASLVFVLTIICCRRYLIELLRFCVKLDGKAIFLAIVACALAGAAATCIHRADADDATYLPKIIHYLAYPKSIMDGSVNELASHLPLALPRAAAPYYPTAYEFAQAAFAFLSHVNFLTVYYVFAPFIVGVLGIIALVWVLSLLGYSARGATYAMVLLVPLILIMGEAHRSYGNISLVRLFQSKYAFVFLGLPVFVGLSLSFLRTRDARIWVCLLVAVLAFCGMTTSALVMLPMLAVVLFAAWWLAEGAAHGWIGVGFTYAMSTVPAAIFALDFWRYASARMSYGSGFSSGFPGNFSGQFSLLEDGAAIPISMVLFAIALLVCLRHARAHVLVISWVMLTVVLYLNPLTAPWIMRHVTSENIYWRLFYLLPFPIILGIACARTFDGLPVAWNRRRWAAGGVIICGAAFLISPTSVLRTGNGASVGFPGWTLDDNARDACDILAEVQDGVMLAPIALAQDMVVLSAKHPQVATRIYFMSNVLTDQPEEYALRLGAASFVAGTGGSSSDLLHILQRDSPASVILARTVLLPSVVSMLKASRLHRVQDVGPWAVYVRDGE